MTRRNPNPAAGASRKPWTVEERAAVIRLYMEMSLCVTQGRPYNKAAMIRARQLPAFALVNRSRGSIEAKLMNITAALDIIADDEAAPAAIRARALMQNMGRHGYKALPNMQRELLADVLERLGFPSGAEAEEAMWNER
jgi:hypothetical protein